MEFGHILMFFITVLISSTVSRSGSYVFVQTGDSVELEIKNKTLLHFNRLVWMNDKAENIVRFVNESGGIKYYIYKDSVDVNNKTLSLTLKNVQKTDSGLYTAKTMSEKTTFVAEHNVSVLDPVDFPVLKQNFTMISVDTCIVNVSCSGHDQTIGDSYYSNNCSQEEVTSFGIQTLALYCIENVVVCNYSNPVSWKNDTIEIHQLCPPHEPENLKENNSSFPLHWLLVITGVSVLVFTAVPVICCSYKKSKRGAQQNDHTGCGQVHVKDSSSASETDHTIYSIVYYSAVMEDDLCINSEG